MTVFGIFWLLCQGFIALVLFLLALGIWDTVMRFLRRLDTKISFNNTKRVYDTPMDNKMNKPPIKKEPRVIEWDDFVKMDPKQFTFVGILPLTAKDRIEAKAEAAEMARQRKAKKVG